MRSLRALVFCLMVSAISLSQEPKADLFGGYSSVNIDTNGLTSRQSANGWEAAISGNFTKWFAVEGDFGGYYKKYSYDLESQSTGCVYLGACTGSVKVTDYSFSAGPRINLRPIFFHALFGGDHLTGTATASGISGSISESQDGLAGLAGGGVQWKIAGPWSVRASVAYVFTRHNIFGGPSVTQNNYRAGAGIVYSFGMRRAPQASQPTAPVTAPQPETKQPEATRIPSGPGVAISPLGTVVRTGRSSGAEVVDEMPGGPAALGGLHPGDVINAVDGKSVKSPDDLFAELANRRMGDKVKLGYLIRGMWQTETFVTLGAPR